MLKNISYTFILLILIFSSCEHFDPNEVDTKSNKKIFKKYLEVELTSDVKYIYCYADFGTDYSVLISFSCDSNTIENIVSKKHMKLTTEDSDNGLFFDQKFKWWDNDKIEKIKPYKTEQDQKFWKYLWYDSINKKAYYQEFSL